MSTFTQGNENNARAAASGAPKDTATKEEIKAAEGDKGADDKAEVPADDPNKPNAILTETDGEKSDRHIASTELEAGDVTDPESQADTAPAEDAKKIIVPGAASGPDVAGVISNDHGKVAYAPAGTLNAAMNGVQEDAAGHVDSIGTDNSSKSGVRI